MALSLKICSSVVNAGNYYTGVSGTKTELSWSLAKAAGKLSRGV